MKKTKKVLLIISVLLITGMLLLPNFKVSASSNLVPTASANIKRYLRRYSSLVSLNSGYMRVFYDNINKNIGIEYYDDNFKIIKKNKLAMELDIYGGFFAGKDAYYIVEGQNNKEEDTSKEVIRVIKYDTNWKRLGASKIVGTSEFAEEVRYPFDAGCVEMTEVNGKLYIVTGHEGYVDPAYNQGHQGYLMIEVDETTLSGRIAHADLSHSFAQYIDHKGDNLYVLELSEGNYRAQLRKYEKSVFSNLDYFTSLPTVSVMKYGGQRTSGWAVSTYASVNGVVTSQNNVLTVGTSIDQSRYDEAVSAKLPHNIYLSVTPMNGFSTEKTNIKWITNYKDDNKAFTGLEITKVNDNRFMISWEEYKESKTVIDNDTLSTNVLHYIFVDENGNKIGNEYTVQASMSDCKPIVKGSKVVYYASNAGMVNFYTIDANTGKFSKVMYRVAGENATWSLNNGVLTISGTGAMFVDPSAIVKLPLSSTLGGYSYSSSDNAWKPIKNEVKKIVIQKGITSIPESQFTYFNNLTDVELPNTLKTIGKSAFQDNYYLRKILIPASVTSIGEDALWSGYYSTLDEHKIIYATVYTPKNSYAESWAKKNKVSVVNADSLNPPATTEPTNKVIPITSVKLDKTNITLQKGKTAKFNATINPSNTTQSKTLTWSSSNKNVATVDANGNIKAVAPGTATITVKTSNGKTVTAKVTVTNPSVVITGVKINQKNQTIMVGKTVKLTATINPSNTTQSKKLTWSTSNKKIATVDKNGVVKGIKAGTVNITVKTSNGKTATVKVTVKKPTPIKSVKLNKKTLKLELNKSATVKATINPGNTTDSKKLTWSSSNKKVAVVDKNGKITAKASGTAKITVKTSNGKKATVKVTVSKISAKKAKISAIKNQVQNGKALKPAVTVKLGKTTLKNGRDYTVSYKNNKKAGKATVTVKFKGNYTGSSKKTTFLIIPSKVNIKNPSTSKKAITVKYSKVSGAKTYQIAYRLKGTKKWKYTTSKSSSKKISKLTSGKQYEVIVRAGIKNGSKTLYGAWSRTKVIKVK